ncbi:acyltransferase [Marinobacter nauticus]
MARIRNIKDCFVVDCHKYNPVPTGIVRKIYALLFTQRYSMSVYLRLTEYFYSIYLEKNRRIYLLIANYFKRKNEVVNQFEHGYLHDIREGTLFHHTGVTLNDNVTIERNVQIFKNVTFALVDGKTVEVGENSIIFSHVIILGKKIGSNCVVGAGSVVTKDVPDNSVVVGNPAKIIRKCQNAHDFIEFK